MSTTSIVVTGANGRMGQTILRCAKEDPEIRIAGFLDRDEKLDSFLKPGVVVIDFTIHTATPELIKVAAARKCPMVIGTTGFTEAELKVIRNASKRLPVMLAPNMSVGVNLLFDLTRRVTAVLKNRADVEIIEKHHRRKKDSPSGTAAKLLEIVAEELKQKSTKAARHGRVGDVGERTASEIGVHAIRGGDFVGEHTVLYAGDGEVVEITHKASSRDIFARGALVAAKWVARQKPGLYDMLDVLELRGA